MEMARSRRTFHTHVTTFRYSRDKRAQLVPILFVDVDGVLSLFGFTPDISELPGPLHWIDGIAHCIPPSVGPRLERLADDFELVWATGWEEKANEHLPHPAEPARSRACRSCTFDGRAVFGSAHWKLDAIDEYAGDRPAAWIDDNLDENCQAWADVAGAPDAARRDRLPAVGLTDEHVEHLLHWAGSLTGDH